MSKDIKSFNDKYQRHGYWEDYCSDGHIRHKTFYQNDKEIGYEEYYWYNGKISKKRYYI
jgi:antitoxin component YwqK of YwqJK toxin-antitoxin module